MSISENQRFLFGEMPLKLKRDLKYDQNIAENCIGIGLKEAEIIKVDSYVGHQFHHHPLSYPIIVMSDSS